jgi:hypothetical protein
MLLENATDSYLLQAGRLRVRVPLRWVFLNRSNTSGRIMVLWSTQPLTEMSIRNLKKIKKPGGKVRPARRADNLAAIY